VVVVRQQRQVLMLSLTYCLELQSVPGIAPSWT
jgi:hypothetical protein